MKKKLEKKRYSPKKISLGKVKSILKGFGNSFQSLGRTE